jgi:glucokinase
LKRFLARVRGSKLAHGSEGGHSDFAPADPKQIRLLEYMLKLFDHVSFEHVCSGVGLPHVYRYLRDVELIPEKPEVAKQIEAAKDPSAVIISEVLDSSEPSKLCVETVDLFVSILAAEAGNLALKFLATGAVYLAGGVAVHTLGVIEEVFMQRFKRKGRFVELMERIPVHVVLTPAGLAGAAVCGLESATIGSDLVSNPVLS